MANLLCIYENKIATVAATGEFLQNLAKHDTRVDVQLISISHLKKHDLNHCDVLLMIRPNNTAFGRIAKMARASGITVLFFLDDDLMHLPEGNIDIPWRKKGLLYSAKQSDVIISSSPYICNQYSKLTGIDRTLVTDTAVPSEDIREHKAGINDRIKIVYAAGIAHKTLFDRFVRPVLEQLDDRFGDKISLTFMGVHPELDISQYKMPISYIESMRLQDYRERIGQENFDIGLAPLVTNDFTKCKYFNKFIEYAMFGIVGIYSNTEPYTFVIKDKENGILSENTPEEWYNTISQAIEQPELVSSCRNNAYSTLRERFDANIIIKKYLEGIPELLKDHQGRNIRSARLTSIKMQYMMSRLGDWIYKAGHYFRQGGMSALIRSIRQHLSVADTVK